MKIDLSQEGALCLSMWIIGINRFESKLSLNPSTITCCGFKTLFVPSFQQLWQTCWPHNLPHALELGGGMRGHAPCEITCSNICFLVVDQICKYCCQEV